MANGPTYFQALLADPKYPGPYKDKTGTLTSVTTPDPYTIQFHLVHPFADFDYVVSFSNTAPVPQAKDTGANYQLHPMSTGPYMFQSYSLNKQLVLVPNPNWTQNEDTEARQLASKIVVDLNVNAGRRRQPAAGRGRPGRLPGLGRAGRGAGEDPVQPVADEERRRRARQPRVVHLHQHQGGAAHQPRLPPGGRVRGEQDGPADRLRRPVRGRRDRQHPVAARHGRVHPVRPVQRAKQADRRPRQGQGGAGHVRPPQRLHHRSGLPQRPAEGGRGRHRPAGGAGPGGDHPAAARLPDGHLLHQLRRRAELRAPAQSRAWTSAAGPRTGRTASA